jgi:hypothetical protein
VERAFPERNSRNIVLTGLPRSGTTLACYLLNDLPNTVALLEPFEAGRFAGLLPEREAVADAMERWYGKTRRRALRKGEVTTRHVGGKIPDNPFGPQSEGEEPRQWLASKGRIRIGKEIGRDFYLVVKDPPMFTALLPILVQRFPTFAVVRNPLAVLASWNSVDIPAREGRVPRAEAYDPDLARRLISIEDRLERQLGLLDWWCERFEQYLPQDHILRYEDIVGSGGRALAAIVPAAGGLDEPLSGRNTNDLYDRAEVAEIGYRLLESNGAYWHFYARESVKELLAQFA